MTKKKRRAEGDGANALKSRAMRAAPSPVTPPGQRAQKRRGRHRRTREAKRARHTAECPPGGRSEGKSARRGEPASGGTGRRAKSGEGATGAREKRNGAPHTKRRTPRSGRRRSAGGAGGRRAP